MKKLILATILVGLIAVPGLSYPTGAPDYLPDLSTWSSSALATHQYWTFSAGHVGQVGSEWYAIPEEVDNPVPPGVSAMIGADSGLNWYGDEDNGYFLGDNIAVAVKIDNYEDGDYKIMWFDVGASAAPTNIACVAHDGNIFDFDYYLLTPDPGSAAEFGLRIVPNPAWEEIHFTIPGPSGAYLDYIHVDTVCIPEPATVLLLGLGGVWLRRINRRGR